MPLQRVVINSVYGEIDLADGTPTVVPLTYNGKSVDKIEIPEGTTFYISDILIGMGFVYWSIEVDRGSGFAPLATFGFVALVSDHTEIKKFRNAITIKGGPGVAMRLTATALEPPQSSYINLQGHSYID